MELQVIHFIILNTILIIINLFLIFILLPFFLDLLGNRIKKIRNFIRKNEGFFSICFICLFALEQVILISLTSLTTNPNILKPTIGLFALIVVTTASLQKFILEKQNEYKKKSLEESNEIIAGLKTFNKQLLEKLKSK